MHLRGFVLVLLAVCAGCAASAMGADQPSAQTTMQQVHAVLGAVSSRWESAAQWLNVRISAQWLGVDAGADDEDVSGLEWSRAVAGLRKKQQQQQQQQRSILVRSPVRDEEGGNVAKRFALSTPSPEPQAPACNGHGTPVAYENVTTGYLCGILTPQAYTVDEFNESGLPTCASCDVTDIYCQGICCNPVYTPDVTNCVCYPGFQGKLCDTAEPFTCGLVLVSPPLDCPVAPINDPSCPQYSRLDNTTMELVYSSTGCKFTNPLVNVTFSEFLTLYNGDSYVGDFQLRNKFYNFKQLFTDKTFTFRHTFGNLTSRAEFLLGLSNFTFTVNPTIIAANPLFFPGGRLYFETKFSVAPHGMSNDPIDRHWIDFYDRPGPVYSSVDMTTTIVVSVVVPIVGLALIGLCTYYIYHRHFKGPK